MDVMSRGPTGDGPTRTLVNIQCRSTRLLKCKKIPVLLWIQGIQPHLDRFHISQQRVSQTWLGPMAEEISKFRDRELGTSDPEEFQSRAHRVQVVVGGEGSKERRVKSAAS